MPYFPPRPEPGPQNPPQQQPEPGPRNPPPRRRPALRQAVFCVSLLLAVYGAIRLAGYGVELLSSRRTAQELREFAAEPDETVSVLPSAVPETPEPAPSAASAAPPEGQNILSEKLPPVEYPNGYALVPRIQKLRKKSEYIIGWLTMESVYEPVVQKDNSFFLDHDAAGKRNSNGAIFMDQDTPLLTRPYTILLYGHNMKSGAMFGSLRKYEDYSWCFRHRVFQFDTLYEEGQYVIFAVETISLTPGKSRYCSLAALCSPDRETRKRTLDVIRNHSLHGAMADVNEEDQVLVLVTCVGDDDERLIVAARRLREGERADLILPGGS